MENYETPEQEARRMAEYASSRGQSADEDYNRSYPHASDAPADEDLIVVEGLEALREKLRQEESDFLTAIGNQGYPATVEQVARFQELLRKSNAVKLVLLTLSNDPNTL